VHARAARDSADRRVHPTQARRGWGVTCRGRPRLEGRGQVTWAGGPGPDRTESSSPPHPFHSRTRVSPETRSPPRPAGHRSTGNSGAAAEVWPWLGSNSKWPKRRA
jgi:hypothetical protein